MILEPAHIDMAGTRPRAVRHGDIYFAHDGADETRRVFIAPMRLDALFSSPPSAGLRVGELGFGTGLNFLAVGETFLEFAPEPATLDYVAFERHPVALPDLERIMRRHASRLTLTKALVNAWPDRLEGWHRRYFAGGRIRLLVYQGDGQQGVSELGVNCHAWLLDGFDPRCNPDMWSETLIGEVARKSEPGARVASFTSQGSVRRRLESVGFEMRRMDQRPHKRHSLAGTLTDRPTRKASKARQVAVVGAGFAGAFTAHLLAIRGIQVHLFDAGDEPLPIAIAHARLSDPRQPMTQLRALASGYSNDWYRRLGACPGVLEVGTETRQFEKWLRHAGYWAEGMPALSLLSASQAREKSGLPGIGPSLWCGGNHTIEHHLIQTGLRHPIITRHEATVASCQPDGANWKLELGSGESASFGCVVVSAGAGSLDLIPALNAHAIDGQMERVHATATLPFSMIGQGYAAPMSNDELALGATFERSPLSAKAASAENIEHATSWLSRLGCPISVTHRSLWRGKRVYSQDRLPMVGEFAAGLYANTGFGASGSLLAPLAAEIIASQIAGDQPPVSRALLDLMRPNR